MDETASKVYNILLNRGFGLENAITVLGLSKRIFPLDASKTDSRIREACRRLRHKYNKLVYSRTTGDNKGIFLAKIPEEIKPYIKDQEHRLKALASNIAKAKFHIRSLEFAQGTSGGYTDFDVEELEKVKNNMAMDSVGICKSLFNDKEPIATEIKKPIRKMPYEYDE